VHLHLIHHLTAADDDPGSASPGARLAVASDEIPLELTSVDAGVDGVGFLRGDGGVPVVLGLGGCIMDSEEAGHFVDGLGEGVGLAGGGVILYVVEIGRHAALEHAEVVCEGDFVGGGHDGLQRRW
jgi:hypothetical protein